MRSEQLQAEIREVNLAFLMLAQRIIRADRTEAVYRLGVTEETAGLIDGLSAGQLLRLAGQSHLMCAPRSGDDMVWSLLAGSAGPASGLHAAILTAGRVPAAA